MCSLGEEDGDLLAESWESLEEDVWNDVLKAEEKSTNKILMYVPGLSMSFSMKCNHMLIASSTDLFGF